MSAVRRGVVARWTARRRPAGPSVCGECTSVFADAACWQCGQLAGDLVAMLAAVVDGPAGVRLVIAERTSEGWVPVRAVPATSANVAALARPGATGPAPDATELIAGLW